MASSSSIVKLNVGGVKYITMKQSLVQFPNSMLGKIFSTTPPSLPQDAEGNYFLNADGEIFKYVLSFLRTGKLWVPEKINDLKRLEIEADLYNIQEFTDSILCFKKHRKLAKHLILLYRVDDTAEPDLIREVYFEEDGMFKPFVGSHYDGSMHISRDFIKQTGYSLVERKMFTPSSMHSFLCMYRLPWFPMNQRLDWVKNWGFEWYRRT